MLSFSIGSGFFSHSSTPVASSILSPATGLGLYSSALAPRTDEVSLEPAPAASCFIKVKFLVVHAGIKLGPANSMLSQVWSPSAKLGMTKTMFPFAKSKVVEWFTGTPTPAPSMEAVDYKMVTTVDDIQKLFGNTVIVDSPTGFFSSVDAPTFTDKIVVYKTSNSAAYSQLSTQARKDTPDDTIVFVVVDELYYGDEEAWGLYYENFGFGLVSYESLINTYKAYSQTGANKTQGFARAFVHELGHAQTLDDADVGTEDNIMCSFFTQTECDDTFSISETQKRAFRAHAQGQCVDQGNFAPKVAGKYSVTYLTSNGICGNRKAGVEEECENDWFNTIKAPNVVSSTFKNPSYCMAVLDNGKYLSVNPENVSIIKQQYPDKVKICKQDSCTCVKEDTSGSSTVHHIHIAVGTPNHTQVLDHGSDPTDTTEGSVTTPATTPRPPVITPPACAFKKESDACEDAVICMDTAAGECLDADGEVVCYCTAEDGCYNNVCPVDGYCPKLRDAETGELQDQVCTSEDDKCFCKPKSPIADAEAGASAPSGAGLSSSAQ